MPGAATIPFRICGSTNIVLCRRMENILLRWRLSFIDVIFLWSNRHYQSISAPVFCQALSWSNSHDANITCVYGYCQLFPETLHEKNDGMYSKCYYLSYLRSISNKLVRINKSEIPSRIWKC